MISIAQKMARLADLFSGNQNGQGLPLSHRNYIVDGNFENWINTSVTTATGTNTNSAVTMYTAIPGTGGVTTVSRLTFSSPPAGMTSPAKYYLQFAQTTAGSGTPAIDQHIESAATLAGQSATFSCWLWCGAGTIINPVIQFSQSFGSGGSPSATVTNQKTTNWVITTTPQRFSIRLDFPSIAGKTLGSNNNDFVDFAVIFPNGTFTVNTAQWQLEQSSPQTSSDLTGAGGLPTAFEYRGPQAELLRVQRYYESSYDSSVTNQAGSLRTIAASPYLLSDMTIRYKQTKRAAPTVTVYSPSSGTANTVAEYTTGTVFNADRAAIVTNVGTQASQYYVNGVATTGNQIFAHWIADARI